MWVFKLPFVFRWSTLRRVTHIRFSMSHSLLRVKTRKSSKSLAVDNVMLKADNNELHKLLTESRTDLQVL
jgi:hypothetical protein